MPFEEEEDISQQPAKIGLKNVSSQKSIFDTAPKKPTQEEFESKVQKIQETSGGYKAKAADLAVQFKKLVDDKTLAPNKNVFAKQLEKEILTNMAELAVEINNDPHEQEGMGSLGWVILLLKTILGQRDRINNLEYTISLLDKKIEQLNKTIDMGKVSG
jgi:hypothetical protein